MKGALYMLWDNAFANYALAGVPTRPHESPDYSFFSDVHISNQYLTRLLDCQHQEKVTRSHSRVAFYGTLSLCFPWQPSIQKLISNCASECLGHLSDEAVHSEAYREDIPGALAALDDLEGAFSGSLVDKALLKEALEKVEASFTAETRKHERNVRHLLSWNLFRTLNHDTVARVGSRSRLQANHTRSSPTIFGVWLTYPYRNSGDTSSLPPASYIAYYREIWCQRLNSPVSS
jgi:proteasome activator subunit 4